MCVKTFRLFSKLGTRKPNMQELDSLVFSNERILHQRQEVKSRFLLNIHVSIDKALSTLINPFCDINTFFLNFFLGLTKFLVVWICVTERHDALYIVGSLEETLELRGMRYHPIDIENTVVRCSSKIAEW